MLDPTFMYFSLLIFSAAQNSCKAEMSAIAGVPGISRHSSFIFPYENKFTPLQSSASESASSSFQISQQYTIPSFLETFISTFINEVNTSPVLANILDVSHTSLQSLENFTHQAVYAILKSFDICNSNELATYATKPITENFEYLTYPMLASIDSNAIGKQLLAEGILNQANAAFLALAFANEMERSAKQTVVENVPESKFQALMNGYVGFLKTQGLYTPEKLSDAARYFGDEVILHGTRFGRRSSS